MAKPLSELHFSRRLPAPKLFGAHSVLIYDLRLLQAVPKFKTWVEKFPAAYGVRSGERLKDVAQLPGHLTKLIRLTEQLSPREMTLVVAGGGSVGDFGGFIASVLKRGVRLVHVPTTWLAAIDSSHGGKTALNVGASKNQVGTFYPANSIYLIRSILKSQTRVRAVDAMGELAKMVLIEGGALAEKFTLLSKKQKRVDLDDLAWRFLKNVIQAKYKVVARDPRELKGLRQVLNLGHTLGHILEAQMHMSHGAAVAQGLHFALNWSLRRKILSAEEFERAAQVLRVCKLKPRNQLSAYQARRPTMSQARTLLMRDKKRENEEHVTFIFLKRVGKPTRELVHNEALLREAQRQGWLR